MMLEQKMEYRRKTENGKRKIAKSSEERKWMMKAMKSSFKDHSLNVGQKKNNEVISILDAMCLQ